MQDFFKAPTPSFTFEIFPPKGEKDPKTLAKTYATIDWLASLAPDLISVTYGAGGSSRDNTIEIASTIQERYGVNSVAHITCVDSTRENIDTILGELKTRGVKNILALRGDLISGNKLGDFRHASELVSYIKSKYDFRIFAACYPEKHIEAPSMAEDLRHLKHKVNCGVDALITQLFFDNDHFFNFLGELRAMGITVPVIAGVMPITSAAQIDKMVMMCGAFVPERVKRFVAAYGHNSAAIREAGTAYATEQIIDLMARGVDGIHIYTMNQADVTWRIAENVRGVLYSLKGKKN